MSYFVAFIFILGALVNDSLINPFPIYLRMGIVAIISWGFYIYGSMKGLAIDDFRFVLSGKRDNKDLLSITSLLGTAFFLGIYFFGFSYMTIQSLILLMIALMGIWRTYKEDQTWNIVFIASLIFVHTMILSQLFNLIEDTSSPSILSRVDYLGLVLLDVILIFGNFLQFKLWKKNIHCYLIYALGFQIGLLTYLFSPHTHPFMPDWLFVTFSIMFLEIGRRTPDLFRYSIDVKQNISSGLIHVGLSFLLLYIIHFVFQHLYLRVTGDYDYMRWMTEALGLASIFYWIAFIPKKTPLSEFEKICFDGLIEVFIGFITICIFAELSEKWMPFFWAVLSIGLVIGSLIKNGPHRLCLYSWIYLIVSIIHIIFLTSVSAISIDIPTFLVVAMQLCYALLVHRKKNKLLKKSDSTSREMDKFISVIFRQPNLTVILPIFLGIGILFTLDFADAILTLLWVGLSCIYLTVGLFVKSRQTIQIAMGALVICSLRLIIFDMVQTDAAIRALVFLGVGSLMLGVSILYKKYKYRIDLNELN
jgi:hypothetical protein